MVVNNEVYLFVLLKSRWSHGIGCLKSDLLMYGFIYTNYIARRKFDYNPPKVVDFDSTEHFQNIG